MLSAPMLFGQNLLTNGDFKAGNTGFTSDYTFGLTLSGDPSMIAEGGYSVTASARNVHSKWADFPDHTSKTSAGRYLVTNGSSDVTKAAWQSTVITVASAKTPYRFEAWISSAYPTVPAILTFEIGNGSEWVELGTTASLSNSKVGEWLFTYADAQFSASGKYYIRLKNANPSSEGNDFGIDDIYFGLRTGSPSVKTTPGSPSPPTYSPKSVGGGGAVTPPPRPIVSTPRPAPHIHRVNLRRPTECDICDSILVTPAQARADLRVPTLR